MSLKLPEQTPEILLQDFLNAFNFSKTTLEFVKKKLERIHLKKGECFSECGKTCKRIGLLFSGLLYATYYSEDKNAEIVSRFFYLPVNFIVTSFESFHYRKPSDESIIAIENSFLFCLSYEDMHQLYNDHPEVNFAGRHIAERSYIQAHQRIHALQTMNSEQRFADLFSKCPELFNKVQKKQMASYLRINRNDLTRLLKNYKI